MSFRKLSTAILLAIMALAIGVQGQQSAQPSVTAPPDTSSKPVVRPKSFDLSAMDKTVNPCEDFYQYACGSWRKNNPIPGDQSRWGRFNELAEYNRQILHDILEKDAHMAGKRTAVEQKVGDMYGSCMDEPAINAKGVGPLKPTLDRIAGIASKDQVIETIAYLQSQGVGQGGVLFQFGAAPDLHNASQLIANVAQSGLGLPDRDYYLADDNKSKETRQKYQEHMVRMFVLLGDDQAAAEKEALAIISIETKLAQATLERVKMRDPKNRDHKMKVTDLEALAPNFKFDRFFAAVNAPAFTDINVVPPDFFQQVNGVMDGISVDDWKSYLRWHTTRGAAPWLSDAFVKEDFTFQQYMSGAKELPARWKRCVQLTDRLLGEALGQEYVKQTFGKDGKERMLKMVQALEQSLGADIQDLPWMTPETKKQAAVKLAAIANKIGYPDNWRDYSTVTVTLGDLLGSIRSASAFERRRNLNKIGKPLDKSEWGMTPPTVNAYYNPAENNINFPAGILQPPFFDKTEDEAVNFGGIGVVIGHELTHGFDDQGSKFDGGGNLSNWWTEADRKEFDKRTTCVADEYSGFVAVDDVHLNGRLTLGENTADNGGLHVSLMALHKAMAGDPSIGKTKEGFTPEQRFFLGFAQVWCQNATPESSRLLAKTDPHSPGEYRTNGTLQNSEDFAKAFGCKAGQKMVSANACHVW
jgi:putative endopeptidase